MGEHLYMSVSGDLRETVTGGTVDFMLRVSSFVLFNDTTDVCAVSLDHPCPFQRGPITITKAVDIPSFLPRVRGCGPLAAMPRANVCACMCA